MTIDIRKGDHVEVQDAFGEWHRAKAVSEIEGTHVDGRKVHDFPVVWVIVFNERTMRAIAAERAPDRIPWPVEAVRPGPPPVPDDFSHLQQMMDDLRPDEGRG